jgi:hypothetical protein
MPTAIIAGLPPDIERRIRPAADRRVPLSPGWSIKWFRSKSRVPGLAPSQLSGVNEAASEEGDAHVLVFRGRDRSEEALLTARVASYFRVRWIEPKLLGLIPHAVEKFLNDIAQVLAEELEWDSSVKPHDESCCLLLPECAFAADKHVRQIWAAAGQAGADRIRAAARVVENFRTAHWKVYRNGVRKWIDREGRVFDHLGPRRGRVAPFPRSWKFSYPILPGFHFDVESRESRAFAIDDAAGRRHTVSAGEHLNMDPHGYVTH